MSLVTKAFYNITLFAPKDYSDEQKAGAAVMQARLNANFQSIFEKMVEHDEQIVGLPAVILAQIPVQSDFVTEDGISGSWRYRKWDNGTIEAWFTTAAISKNITTASGALYSAEEEIALPSGLFANIDCANVTAICTSPIFASVKSVTTSTLTALLCATASTLYSLTLCVHIVGR